MADSGVKASGRGIENREAGSGSFDVRSSIRDRRRGSEIRDDPTVVALRQGVQGRWADGHLDRPHAAVAEGELTDAGVIAAELGSEALGRPESQGVADAGRAAPEADDVPIVDASVALRVAVAELAEPDVLVAEEEGVAQPVRDVAEPGNRTLRAQDRGRPPGSWGPDVDPRDECHAEGTIASLAGDPAGLGIKVVPDAAGIIAHRPGVVLRRDSYAREEGIGRVTGDAQYRGRAAAGAVVRLDGCLPDGGAGGDGRPLVVVQARDVPRLGVVVLLTGG